MDKEKIIEKHILRYIFVHGKYEFKGDPKFELYNRISQSIEKELGVTIVGINDFYNVFDKLINSNIILVKCKDEKAIVKEGTIEPKISHNMLDYVIENEYVDLKQAFQYADQKYCDVIDIFMAQFKRMEKTENELRSQKEELLSRIREQENQIKNFYNNILTILGILVAVFSIIGFNIGGIKFIVGSSETLEPWVYAGSIAIINICIILSMYFLFALVNKVIHGREKNSGIFSNKIFWTLLFVLIVIIAVCFIIA